MNSGTLKTAASAALLVVTFFLGRLSVRQEITDVAIETAQARVQTALPSSATVESTAVHPADTTTKKATDVKSVVQSESNTKDRVDSAFIKDLMNSASELIDKKKVREAFAQVDEMIAKNPTNVELLADAAEFYLGVGQDPKKAASLFEKAYDLKPQDGSFNGIISSLNAQNDPKESLRVLQQLSEKHSTRLEPHIALGDFYLRTGSVAEAKRSYENAKGSHVDDPQIYERLAQAYAVERQPAKAAESFAQGEKFVDLHIRKATENSMSAPRMEKARLDFRMARVYALRDAGDTTEATRLFEEVEDRFTPEEVSKIRDDLVRSGRVTNRPVNAGGE